MKRGVLVLAVVCTLFLAKEIKAEEGRTYYYQMVCGSEKDLSKKPGAKPIGSKLRNQLENRFRWKHFAELTHGECVLPSDRGTVIVKLPEHRELRLHRNGKQLEAQLFRNGQVVRTTRAAIDLEPMIMGGDQGEEGCWFVILRSDKPTTMTVAEKK
jgi:hypothetical protein